jgi:hypothetical protein
MLIIKMVTETNDVANFIHSKMIKITMNTRGWFIGQIL